MPYDTPLETVTTLVDAMNRQDLAAALDCYEAQAVFVAEPGLLARGTTQIREALQGLLAMRPALRTLGHSVLACGDVAMYQARWQMNGQAPDGSSVALAGSSADLLRRGTDGTWRIAVDNPWGAELLGAASAPAPHPPGTDARR